MADSRPPDWESGSINVATQCQSCHATGTAEFNSFNSGKHKKHVVDKNISCTSCHDSAKLANGGHFADLSTSAFEQPPSESIKSSMSYVNGTCQTTGCHGSKSW